MLLVVRKQLEFSHNGETGREHILRTPERESLIVFVNPVARDFLQFFYVHRGFDDGSVKGLVAKLIHVKDDKVLYVDISGKLIYNF